MYYNLKGFGEALKEIRHKIHLTQKDISMKVSINLETLRKIENGLVLPKQETLDLLSSALNMDIAELFLTYRMDDYDELEDLKRELDFHLDGNNYSLLQEDLIQLKKLATHNMNHFFRNQVLQLIALTEGVLLELREKRYDLQIECYIQALSYTIENFNLEHYQTYYYNELELRLLMNIGLAKYNLEDVSHCVEILLFCSNFSKKNIDIASSNLLAKLHYNLSYTFHRIDLHEKALEHANLGIQYAVSNRSIAFLAHLYFRKGIAQFHLDIPQHLETLQYAKNLFLISNHEDLYHQMQESCKVHYGIIL
ncbi:MAG: helix-turn-helix domain-containing protein [Candidatus Niameybacter stercoravium]|nr:helix-turn-helix domain-containing protein [Candidatus Niameybacter stercoravium]